MKRQRHICVIDWFGVSFDGVMPERFVDMWRDLVRSFPGRAAEPAGPGVYRLAGRAELF